MLPKSGRKFPAGGRPSETDYLRQIGAALRGELGGSRATTKSVMRWTGASDRSARNWINGVGGPNGYHLICLARECDAVLGVMLAMSGRSELALSADLRAIEAALSKASQALDALKRVRSSEAAH